MWVLGSSHTAEDYPFNVKAIGIYKIYLGVENHRGELTYYKVYVKFRNQTEALSDESNEGSSVLDSIFEYGVFLRNEEIWEKIVTFSFEGISFDGNSCRVSNLVLEGHVLSAEKSTSWNGNNRGFYFQLLFELWIYNVTVSRFQYHNRFVSIWLNMTTSA